MRSFEYQSSIASLRKLPQVNVKSEFTNNTSSQDTVDEANSVFPFFGQMTAHRLFGGTFPERLGQANLDMLLGFEKIENAFFTNKLVWVWQFYSFDF